MHLRTIRSAFVWALGAAACADADEGPEGESGSASAADTPDPEPTGDDAADQLPPVSADALRPWLEASDYLAWTAESGVHDSAGPHGDGVRTFVNDALLASLAADSAQHPVDAAVVKELYGGGAIAGWAVMVKVTGGTGGESWYWYEGVGNSLYADGTDVGLCTGCHAGGEDQILTPYPLQ